MKGGRTHLTITDGIVKYLRQEKNSSKRQHRNFDSIIPVKRQCRFT